MAGPRLDGAAEPVQDWPSVTAIVPARDEERVVGRALKSLLAQDFPGAYRVILVDDHSRDGTRAIGCDLAAQDPRLVVMPAPALPEGWMGKLWALLQGVRRACKDRSPEFLWFTDADIEHEPDTLRRLVARACRDQRDLVSLMVRLRCSNVWERLVIPAFVFFFQKLYPFAWVADPKHPTAAAAGGCVLLRVEALARGGGLERIRGALIDDCALGRMVKSSGGRTWLGLTRRSWSLRGYDGLDGLWRMVARSAYTQLNHSPWQLLAASVGMAVLYLAPVVGVLAWPAHGHTAVAAGAFCAWGAMTVAYLPTVRLYGLNVAWALTLPGVAALYMLMTVDSARQHWMGRGGQWKGRVSAAFRA